MYVNVLQKKHHYDINVVTHKSFTCKTFFKNRGFSYEKLRITANNRDKLRKAKTSCSRANMRTIFRFIEMIEEEISPLTEYRFDADIII